MNRIRTYGVVFYLLALLLASCSEPEEEVLREEKMTRILIEIYLAESKVSSLGIPTDSAKKLFKIYEEKILNDFNVSDSLYFKSYQYYMQRPAQLEQIYQSVIDSLGVRERVFKLENSDISEEDTE